jgi:hypothetical protein
MRADDHIPVHSEKTARAPVSQSSTPACGSEASRRLMGNDSTLSRVSSLVSESPVEFA